VTTMETMEYRAADGLPMPGRAEVYALLLGLAGRVPDETLAEMRLCLADEETSELVDLLATALDTGRLALTDDEAALVRALFEGCDADPGLAENAPRHGAPPPAPYRFGDQDGRGGPAGDGRETLRDAMDEVAVGTGERLGGLVAIWRVFRHSADGAVARVYLAEAEAGEDLAEIVAELQYELADASADIPRVEVFAEGASLVPYHDAALAGATLVWAAAETHVRLARAFDGADREDGPFFHPDHPRLGGTEGEQVLAYLRSGEVVLNLPGALDDVLDDDRMAAVPIGFRSDGRWVWPDTVSYYLKRHGIAPEPDLLAHALGASSPPRPLSRLARHQVLTTLFAPTGGEPVWQAG
jgi:hypothetical protein